MTDIINPITAEVTQVENTIADRALGDKPTDVCIDPRDERVDIDMAKLATDTTPHTDIEAEMAKAKQHCEAKASESNINFYRGESPDVVETDYTCIVCGGEIKRGWSAIFAPSGIMHPRPDVCQRTLEREHAERSRYTPTTDSFMDILNEISFQQFMASIPRVLCLPAPKPAEKPTPRIISPRKIDEWVRTSAEQRTEKGKAGLILDMLDMIEAIALLRGKSPDIIVYLYLPWQIFGLPKREIFDLYRNVSAHYNSALEGKRARISLGDDGKARRL